MLSGVQDCVTRRGAIFPPTSTFKRRHCSFGTKHDAVRGSRLRESRWSDFPAQQHVQMSSRLDPDYLSVPVHARAPFSSSVEVIFARAALKEAKSGFKHNGTLVQSTTPPPPPPTPHSCELVTIGAQGPFHFRNPVGKLQLLIVSLLTVTPCIIPWPHPHP